MVDGQALFLPHLSSVTVRVLQVAAGTLGQGLAEGAPGMEAAGEGVLLVALADQAQAAGVLVLLGAHVLDIDL